MVKEFKEKTITINLRKAFEKPTTKRTTSAKNILINAIKKETRAKIVKISNKVNEELMPDEKYEPKQEKKKDDKKTEEKK